VTGDVPVVHVVTDDDILGWPDFLVRAADVLAALGWHGALHVRGHRTPGRVLYDISVSLAPLAARARALLVINDRVDVALAAGAGGVQVGPRSLPVEDARRVAPGLCVGESVHDTKLTTADWVVAGHVFETPSHAGEQPRGVDFVRDVARRVTAPIIAIGGVRPGDVPALKSAGAHGVAVIRGVWHAADSAQAVRDYLYFFV
jgi:thiazole tautomerase (transcriptional regulator TenI)